MSRFRNKFIAGFLVAFWLLATQHCGLEAAGVIEIVPDQTCCPGGEERCSHDGCDTVESGSYRIDCDSPMVPLPQFPECFCLICSNVTAPALAAPAAETPRENLERPLNWVPIWQFVQRAALSPRAPSLELA